MFNPCVEHCFNRYGKQYSSECDEYCDYAKAVKEKKMLEEKNKERENVLEEIKNVYHRCK